MLSYLLFALPVASGRPNPKILSCSYFLTLPGKTCILGIRKGCHLSSMSTSRPTRIRERTIVCFLSSYTLSGQHRSRSSLAIVLSFPIISKGLRPGFRTTSLWPSCLFPPFLHQVLYPSSFLEARRIIIMFYL
jgi:hypothetical protein